MLEGNNICLASETKGVWLWPSSMSRRGIIGQKNSPIKKWSKCSHSLFSEKASVKHRSDDTSHGKTSTNRALKSRPSCLRNPSLNWEYHRIWCSTWIVIFFRHARTWRRRVTVTFRGYNIFYIQPSTILLLQQYQYKSRHSAMYGVVSFLTDYIPENL